VRGESVSGERAASRHFSRVSRRQQLLQPNIERILGGVGATLVQEGGRFKMRGILQLEQGQ